MFAICACDSNNSDVLSTSAMEDVLYDYHLAQGLIEQLTGGVEEREDKAQDYINAVFQKHGITEAQFDSSVIYYNRHTKDLYKIYENLRSRLSEETEAIQIITGSNDMTAIFAEGGDTTNIWNASPMLLLRNKNILRSKSYTIIADTAFHYNDMFILTFNPLFVKENQSDRNYTLYVGLNLEYKDGKTIGQTRQINYTGAQQFTITAKEDQPLSKVSGFFYYSGKDDSRNYCIVNGISFVRMHESAPVPSDVPADTIKADTIQQDTTPVIHERRLTPEEVRRQNQTGEKINIQAAPSVRSRNTYGPRRRTNNTQQRRTGN